LTGAHWRFNQDTGKPPRRGGKRLFQPTVEQRKNIKVPVALGIPERAICAIVRDARDRPIDEKTLRKHFKKEIETRCDRAQHAGRLVPGRDNPRHRSAKSALST
jgi:hypothetical protein